MYIIRTIKESDLEAFYHLSLNAGLGLVSLPKNYQKLKNTLQASIAALAEFNRQDSQKYIFILEETETLHIGGCCSIASLAKEVSYCYQVQHEPLPKLFPQTPTTTQVLVPFKYNESVTELCSLYLLPILRQKGVGKLLSLSRFLFIGQFAERFQDILVARMRGHITSDGTALFWEAIGKNFFNVPYVTILALISAHPENIGALLSTHPIYVSLLPPNVQELIGTEHPHTVGATNMLTRQGFKFFNMIDLLDGGPWLEAQVKEIEIIKGQGFGTLTKITDKALKSEHGLISNAKLDFRACCGYWEIDAHGGIILERKVANSLQIEVGEKISFSKVP